MSGLRSLSAKAIQLVPNINEGATPPDLEGADVISRSVSEKLEVAIDPDELMLDAMVSPKIALPYSTLAHVRRLLVRDIL